MESSELFSFLSARKANKMNPFLSEIGYQSWADKNEIRIVFVFVVHKDGESDKKWENAE